MDIGRYILEVLIEKSSREKPLQQKEVIKETKEYLKNEKKMSEEELPSDSTIKRRINELVDFYDEDENEPGVHCITSKEGSRIGYWIENALSDEELRYVFDSILYSDILTHDRVESMIERMRGAASKAFRESTEYRIRMTKHLHMSEIDTLANVGIISDAINRNHRIEFILNVYEWTKNKDTGKMERMLVKYRESRYLCSPLDIIYNRGKYYLLAANSYQEKNGGYYFYRVDLMSEIRITDEKAISKTEHKMHDTDDLFEYRVRNQYMYSGEVSTVKLRIRKRIFQQLVDWFGDEFEVKGAVVSLEEKEEYLDVRVRTNKGAFMFWVLQYGQDVEVLEPKDFREQVRSVVNAMADKYNKDCDRREGL